MRKRLLNYHPFFTRTLLVILTMLLLPSMAWAQTIKVDNLSPDANGDFNDTSGGIITSGTVKFDATSNTLTLDGATIEGTIEYSGDNDLTIHLKGVNFIGTYASPQLEKGFSTVSTVKLTFTSEVDNNNRPTGKLYFPHVTNLFYGFSDIVYENGLDYGVVNVYPQGDTPCVGEIEYGLTIGDTQVTSANYSPIKNGDGNSINASYNKDTHTLTLDGATLTNTIDWGTDADLTIQLKGNNSIKLELDGTCITATATTTARNITFTRGDATKPCSLQLSTETPSTVIDGFANSGTPTMGTGLTWFEEEKTGSNVTKAFVAEDYKIEVGGKRVHSGNASDVLGDSKVTYNVGSNTLTLNGASITGAIWMDTGTEDLTVALNGTCSVTNTSGTYALYTNGGKFNFVKASGATSAELTATCGNGYNPISFYSSSLGDGLYWALTTPVTTTSIIITDDDSKALLAPTIAFDANKDYFATDKIAVTRNDKDNISTDIFYTWGNAEIGTLYVDTVPKALAKYDATNQIPVANGTLRAWVGYKYGTDEYVLSLVASQAFAVKTDIAKCNIDIVKTQSYTGSKVEPTFTVKDGDGASSKTLTKETDYTVAYYAVVNDVAGTTPIDMVDVGKYQIVISGKGDYGGKIEVPFEITKANLSIVTIEAIADQNYTGSEIKPEIKVTLNDVTLTPDDYGYSVGYSNNTNVPASGATSGPTVTLTALATSKYFTEGTTKTAAFNIVPKSIEGATVTLSGDGFDTEKKCFVYNGQNQTPTVTVKDGEALLTLDTDYTLTNEGGTNAGEYTVTVTGMGNYNKTATATFTISKGARSGIEYGDPVIFDCPRAYW